MAEVGEILEIGDDDTKVRAILAKGVGECLAMSEKVALDHQGHN